MMCSKLDDYLCGDLPDAERKAFEAHISVCGTCAENVELEQQMMSRLCEASMTLEHPPASIGEHPKPLPKDRRGRLAVATSIAALMLFTMILTRSARPPIADGVGENTSVAAASPTVQLADGQSAASIPSGDPDIRIMMVFSGHRDAADSSLSPTDPNVP